MPALPDWHANILLPCVVVLHFLLALIIELLRALSEKGPHLHIRGDLVKLLEFVAHADFLQLFMRYVARFMPGVRLDAKGCLASGNIPLNQRPSRLFLDLKQ